MQSLILEKAGLTRLTLAGVRLSSLDPSLNNFGYEDIFGFNDFRRVLTMASVSSGGGMLRKEEESEAEVRREDQDNINKFARLNARLHEVRSETSMLKVRFHSRIRFCWVAQFRIPLIFMSFCRVS